MSSLEGLNPVQKQAVSITDRHLLVVAGAGSGKTRVLTNKIAYLVGECGVTAESILAMTFSNQAASEMAYRVHRLLPTHEKPRWIGTFHSICLRLLKEFSQEAGLSRQFTIYDETDQLTAIKRALKELNLDPKNLPPKVIRWHISQTKNETGDVLNFLRNEGSLTQQGLSVVARYEEILRENNAMDFGDLLTRMLDLLRSHSNVKTDLCERFTRILIDEYQDTNHVQKELIKKLTGPHTIVCAVGDEDQSIYGWRGARVENILEFEDDFSGSQIIKLEQNYRSTKKILEVANHVIGNNVGRRGKILWTDNEEGDLTVFTQAEDDYSEAAFVMDRMDELLSSGSIHPKEVAIFYRTHAQSRLFEDECRRRNRAYRVYGGIRFYDRAEVKDTLAFLRFALNPTDTVSFSRIINNPARGIGDKTVQEILSFAQGRSILEVLPSVAAKGKAGSALRKFHEWFDPFSRDVWDMAPAEAAEFVLTQSGYIKSLEMEKTLEAESRLENIEELLRSMSEFTRSDRGGVPDYLDRISLVSDTDKYNTQEEAITMMTVHNSKGLEFDAVFVVGLEEGMFPHQRSIEDGDREEIEEERRLCYVAMTRARKRLYLTAARRRRLYHSTHYNPVSRFVGEIPAKLLEAVGTMEARFDEYRQEAYDDDGLSTETSFTKRSRISAATGSPYGPGAKVLHPDFGFGTVKKCEGSQENLKLTIQFQNAGTKKVMLNYCDLELVDR